MRQVKRWLPLLGVMWSSSEGDSITIASESISACDSRCGPIFCVSHPDEPRVSRNTKRLSRFFLGTHCVDRIGPLIDVALMFPVKGFVCVVSLSRHRGLMTVRPSHYDVMVSDEVSPPPQYKVRS